MRSAVFASPSTHQNLNPSTTTTANKSVMLRPQILKLAFHPVDCRLHFFQFDKDVTDRRRTRPTRLVYRQRYRLATGFVSSPAHGVTPHDSSG
jgi:hypothetical protein